MTSQLSFFAEQASPERQDILRHEARRLTAVISELSVEIEKRQRFLDPYRREEARLKAAIRNTHGQPDGVVVFTRDRAAERKPLYEGLLQLSLEYGEEKNQLQHALTMRRGYERDLVRIEKELNTHKRRKHKHAQAKN